MQIGHMTPTSRLIKSQKRGGGREEVETEKQQSEEQNYNTKLILNRVKHTHTDSEHNWLKNSGPQ